MYRGLVRSNLQPFGTHHSSVDTIDETGLVLLYAYGAPYSPFPGRGPFSGEQSCDIVAMLVS